MKKTILIFTLITFVYISKAQKAVPPIDSITHRITYVDVVQANGSKDQLFDKGLNYLAIAFKSSNDVIQIKDKENGKIVGKWMIQPLDARLGFVSATITLLFKDGRYKYIITDLDYQGTSEFKPWQLEDDPSIWKVNLTKGGQRHVKDGTFAQITVLVDELKKYMSADNKQNEF